MTLDQVASFLKLSRDTVYRLTQSATIPASKVGNQWRYQASELDQWLRNNSNREKRSAIKDRKSRARRSLKVKHLGGKK